MTERRPDNRARVDLLVRDFDLATLVALRHELQRELVGVGLGELPLYRFVVAVNEITTNAVQHGGGAGRLELWRSGDRLYCRITDRGPGIPAHRLVESARPPATALSGRGLWLARHGSTDLTVASDSGGTTVTLTHPVDEG